MSSKLPVEGGVDRPLEATREKYRPQERHRQTTLCFMGDDKRVLDVKLSKPKHV